MSTYPILFDRLAERGWTRDQLKQLAGLNFLRVFKSVEDVRDKLIRIEPMQTLIPDADLRASEQTETCRSDFDRNAPTETTTVATDGTDITVPSTEPTTSPTEPTTQPTEPTVLTEPPAPSENQSQS